MDNRASFPEMNAAADRWSLARLAHQLHGELLSMQQADTEFSGAAIDSRSIQAGELFVACAGEHVDGHDYLGSARENGAAAALVSRPVDDSLPQVAVNDVPVAFASLGKSWRSQFSCPVVGITGSNGKTSTKSLLSSILSVAFDGQVLVTEGNLNNELGVPLTLLRLKSSHRAAVIEMGAARVGDIAHLADLACPTVGVVTNAGPAHLEGFGSLAGVATGKGEMFDGLGDADVAVVNADDPFFAQWSERAAPARVISFGLMSDADVTVSGGIEFSDSGSRFEMLVPSGSAMVDLPLPGQHQVCNALAAAAAASALGVSVEQIAEGLAAAEPVAGRLKITQGRAGWRVVDDAYNANPASVAAGIDWLAKQPGKRCLVLGAMAELGDESDALHRAVGEQARQAGIDYLVAVAGASLAADGFGRNAMTVDSAAAAAESVLALPEAGVVLVKGSRSAAMEHCVAALLDSTAGEISTSARQG